MSHALLAIPDWRLADWDAIVIGAGPAGAILSRRLALAGARVLLVDKKAFPRAKVCGACLNPDALSELGGEGLATLVDNEGGIPLTAFQVGLGRRIARFSLPQGRALSRERFDNALVTEAVDAGALFVPEVFATVEAVTPRANARQVRCDRRGQSVVTSAKVVIVAAGLGHRALDLVPGIKTRLGAAARIGAGCTLDAFPDEYVRGVIHMAVGCGGYVGLVRVEDDRLNVGAAFDRSFVREAGSPGLAAALVLDEAGFPEIDALAMVPWQGTVGLTQRTKPVALYRLMLIGDATGYVEPFTGQGMACALASARAAVPLVLRGIESWEPALEREWTARHRAVYSRRLWLCRGLVQATRRPLVARAVFSLAARVPRLAGLMISHVSAPPILAETTRTWP
jgi:flavin-dependent dehydrogenase